MTHHLPLFTSFCALELPRDVPDVALEPGTILRYHYFVVVTEITTRANVKRTFLVCASIFHAFLFMLSNVLS